MAKILMIDDDEDFAAAVTVPEIMLGGIAV